MTQLMITNIEEDILASLVRRQSNLIEELIVELKDDRLSGFQATDRLKRLEKNLKRLAAA